MSRTLLRGEREAGTVVRGLCLGPWRVGRAASTGHRSSDLGKGHSGQGVGREWQISKPKRVVRAVKNLDAEKFGEWDHNGSVLFVSLE